MAAVQASATSFTPVKTSPSLVEATQPPTTILTPELVLGASILYMMSSDGEIDDKENLAFFCKLSVRRGFFQCPFDRFRSNPLTRFQGGLQYLDQGSLALLDGGRMDA